MRRRHGPTPGRGGERGDERGGERGDERGSVPIELALGLGLLVLPVAMLVALLPGWAERTAVARVAAREAARIAVLADTPEAGRAAGEGLVVRIADNHDIPPEDLLQVQVLVPADPSGDLLRGGEVVATVRVAIPVPVLPLTGGVGPLWRTATHRERIDDHRSLP
jgi:hypothetical protein